MNRKVIFSPDHGEQYEIRHSLFGGYRVYRLDEQGEAHPISEPYHTAGELVDGLIELAIFSGEQESTLAEINDSLRTVAETVQEYCTLHGGY